MPKPPRGICSVDGCGRPHFGKGFCDVHYQRWLRHGAPILVSLRSEPAETRFWAKVDKGGDCWLWTAYIDKDGYGHFKNRSRDNMAHRWAYAAAHGAIPDGLTIDHLCRVKRCVNPAHMELVPIRENVRRSGAWDHNAAKTQCPKGHPYDEANTIWERTHVGSGWARKCLACRQERDRNRHR